jgi:hypothetical protein
MRGRERNPMFFEKNAATKDKPSKNYLRIARETGNVLISNRSLLLFPVEIFTLQGFNILPLFFLF